MYYYNYIEYNNKIRSSRCGPNFGLMPRGFGPPKEGQKVRIL